MRSVLLTIPQVLPIIGQFDFTPLLVAEDPVHYPHCFPACVHACVCVCVFVCVCVCVCQVWNANVLVDRFMGQRSGAVPAVGHTERVTGKLMGRRRHRNEETQGTITFKIECSNDLRAT